MNFYHKWNLKHEKQFRAQQIILLMKDSDAYKFVLTLANCEIIFIVFNKLV